MKNAIGSRIKTLRERRGLSQEQLAGATGYSARHVSGVETGSRRPGTRALKAISRALGTTPEGLIHTMTDDALAALIDENTCPTCRAALSIRQVDNSDDYERELEMFECGAMRGVEYRPCPSDPNFPEFSEFELTFLEGESEYCACIARGSTERSKRIRLQTGEGRSREVAAKWVERDYLIMRYGYEVAEERIPQHDLLCN